jgi:hypothetical protein
VVLKRASASRFGILVDAFLEHGAEGVPDLVEVLGLLLRELLEVAEHTPGHTLLDGGEEGDLSWIISRETLSGKSAESTSPRTKRRYLGRSSASSVMNTRLT